MNDEFNNIPLAIRAREGVTVLEAAQILNNNNPYVNGTYNSNSSNVDATIDLIVEAVKNERIKLIQHSPGSLLDEELKSSRLSADDLMGDDLSLFTFSLAAWCDSIGIPHPFKTTVHNPPQTSPAPNEELEKLLARIEELETENIALKKEMEDDNLDARQENTYFAIIAGLLDVDKNNDQLSLSRPHPTAQIISKRIELKGISKDSKTIARHLQSVSEYLKTL